MKKMALVGTTILSIITLSACGAQDKDNSKQNAKADAQSVLNYVYMGNESGASDVLSETPEDNKAFVIDKLEEKQTDKLISNGNIDDYILIADGSDYTAEEIISDYSEAYYKQISKVGHSKIKSVSLNGDTAKVTAVIKPIAGLSEAHPIGEARTEVFGGLDNDTILRESQNKDVKTIQKMITLKLYSVYYGEMGKEAEKSESTQEITFSLKKSGQHYKANEATILELSKNSRANVYAKSDDVDGSNSVESSAASTI